eukprot:6207297-Ditylum_brightwellii.AAC.1
MLPILSCPKQTPDNFLTCGPNPETWKSLLPTMTIAYNEYNADPILCILMNAVLTNTAIGEVKKRHPAIQWME